MESHHIMVIMIVLIVMVASVFRAKYHHSRRSRLSAPGIAPEETERLRAEVKALKERLQVLERIAIEKENSLEREIEALRDR